MPGYDSWFNFTKNFSSKQKWETQRGLTKTGDSSSPTRWINKKPLARTTTFRLVDSVKYDGAPSSGFGYSSDISGNWIVVGTPYYRYGDYEGRVYIYYYDGTSCSLFQTLPSPTGWDGERFFGYDVSVCGDYIAVGSRSLSPDGGFIHIYHRSAYYWVLEHTITDPEDDNQPKAITLGNNRLIAGNGWLDIAYCYRRSGTNWVLEHTFVPPAPGPFGFPVDCDYDVNEVIIGAQDMSDIASKAGAAFIYKRSGTNWTLDQKLYSSTAEDQLGRGVSITNSDAICIKSPTAADGGGIYYDTGTWSKTYTLPTTNYEYDASRSVSINDNIAIVGDAGARNEENEQTGAVNLYIKTDGVWELVGTIIPSDLEDWDQFGMCVRIDKTDKTTFIVSSWAGFFYVYKIRLGLFWAGY